MVKRESRHAINPHTHAIASAKRLGGEYKEYLDIHEYMDSSKHAVADMRHRILTHTPWFCENVIPYVFPQTRVNSVGKIYSPKQEAYNHIAEDYAGQIPATADWFLSLDFAPWMENGKARCPSAAPLDKASRKRRNRLKEDFSSPIDTPEVKIESDQVLSTRLNERGSNIMATEYGG